MCYSFYDTLDVVKANLSLLDTGTADGEVLNIGSSDNITINKLAEYVIDETGVDEEPIHHIAKDADARHTHADISKARELIEYNPSVSIREGVSQFINWYNRNRNWYEPLIR